LGWENLVQISQEENLMKAKSELVLPLIVMLVVTLACGQGTVPTAQPSATVPPPLPATPQPTVTPDYSGPCANVLYPFVPGRQWIYQKIAASADGAATPTPDPLTSKFGISVVEVNDPQAVLKAVDLGTGATSQTTADCQDGGITNFPLMTLGSLFGNYLGGNIQMVYVSGVFAPAKVDLDASGWNMQWQGEYVAAGDVTLSSEGEQTTITLSDSPIRMTWQNAGQETITVPAGMFEEAYKVTRTAEVDATINAQGLSGQGTLTIETNHWFAPYVGLLKTEIVSAQLTTFGITFPIEMAGSSVVLFEYTPG
jgi:hypothetical protein